MNFDIFDSGVLFNAGQMNGTNKQAMLSIEVGALLVNKVKTFLMEAKAVYPTISYEFSPGIFSKTVVITGPKNVLAAMATILKEYNE